MRGKSRNAIHHPALSEKLFSPAEQEIFARASGDRNPMHMDPLAARRTQVGLPVVHGMHTAIWALDAVASRHSLASSIRSVRVNFHKPIYVGETAVLLLRKQSGNKLYADVVVESTLVVTIILTLGENIHPLPFHQLPNPAGEVAAHPNVPLELSFAEMKNRSGWLVFEPSKVDISSLFPCVARVVGSTQLRALASISRLVGMVCPGHHSMFKSLNVNFQGGQWPETFHYAVSSADARYGLVTQAISGAGLTGVVEAFVRTPPCEQAAITEIAKLVKVGEFAGSDALVIGGSRGLGEVAAKIIAAGGGRVTITYAVGKMEAERVAAEIRGFGGSCDLIPYDVLKPASQQLMALSNQPRTVYYFATPLIFRRKSSLYTTGIFDHFVSFYVQGFCELCTNLLSMGQGQLTVFYPSSVYVEKRPADMTEYAMAKAAGEILCSDLGRFLPQLRIVIHRLPPVATDQTLSVTPIETASGLTILLPLVRDVERIV